MSFMLMGVQCEEKVEPKGYSEGFYRCSKYTCGKDNAIWFDGPCRQKFREPGSDIRRTCRQARIGCRERRAGTFRGAAALIYHEIQKL